MEFEIRSTEPTDAHELSDLAHRAKSSWGYPREWIASWTSDLTLTPEYLRAHSGFVALDGGKPVGVCVLEAAKDNTRLEHVWVDPDYQGRGIGRELVTRALARARDAGLQRVEVFSDPFAEPFYLRLGARRIGSTPAPQPGAPARTLPVLEFTMASHGDNPVESPPGRRS